MYKAIAFHLESVDILYARFGYSIRTVSINFIEPPPPSLLLVAINAVNKRKLRFLTAIFIRDQLHYVYVIHTHELIFLNYKGGVLFLLVFEGKNYASSHEED